MPNAYVKSIFEIDIEKLADSGVKGIITDLDNTLVGWDVKNLLRVLNHGLLRLKI